MLNCLLTKFSYKIMFAEGGQVKKQRQKRRKAVALLARRRKEKSKAEHQKYHFTFDDGMSYSERNRERRGYLIRVRGAVVNNERNAFSNLPFIFGLNSDVYVYVSFFVATLIALLLKLLRSCELGHFFGLLRFVA